MPLPDNFSDWEHLQSTLRIYHNKMVREEFSDITADDDISIPRSSLKRACLLADDDTVDMTILRFWLFFMHTRKARDFQAPLFGMPVADYEERVRYKPQVTLYFGQDDDSVPQGGSPSNAELSFRLINETPQTITESELNTLALRIKNEFGTANGYRWRKGKILCTYKNIDDGINSMVYAYSESEGTEVIRKICDAANRPFDNDYLTIHESRRSWPSSAGTQVILGKSRKKPVQRPIVYVRFRRATVSIHGLPNPITLVGRRWDNSEPLQVF
jgi:hypothetical protein